MRLGKRERLTLQAKQAVAMAVKARIARAGPFIKGLRSSCNIVLPVGKPSFQWGWNAYTNMSILRASK